MTAMLDASEDAAGLEALLRSERFEQALCVRLEFASGTLRASNRVLSFTHRGETWRGLGDLVGVTQAAGGPDNLTPVMTYTLGLPAELVDRGELYRIPELIGNPPEYADRPAQLMVQLFRADADGQLQPFDVPKVLHSGRMFAPRLSIRPGGFIQLQIDSESLLVRKRQPPAGKLTDADQRSRHPDDPGLEFIPNATSGPLNWLNS